MAEGNLHVSCCCDIADWMTTCQRALGLPSFGLICSDTLTVKDNLSFGPGEEPKDESRRQLTHIKVRLCECLVYLITSVQIGLGLQPLLL